MSTSLVRTCDVCGERVPASRPSVTLAATIRGVTAARTGVPEPIDVCSAECIARVIHGLYRDATTPARATCRQCGETLEPETEGRYCSDGCENEHDEDLRDRAINQAIDRMRGK